MVNLRIINHKSNVVEISELNSDGRAHIRQQCEELLKELDQADEDENAQEQDEDEETEDDFDDEVENPFDPESPEGRAWEADPEFRRKVNSGEWGD